ncbi:HEAT repeat domain-containing protein [Dictyobacter kobayashii]|uniref:HEAT repeat domain-containing protein n=1 Tax=Dictyobacter kobayashii TaxID=2014872 RepID=A0A402AV02_9CHLR|nr:HEAT repeat domain-containing protein [Dictyobacter kobayashii]GCE22889.1 hypothetical protein KDK_66890 [Dictyobacter kobayashii]
MEPQKCNAAKEIENTWHDQKQAPDTLLASVLNRLEQRQPYLQPGQSLAELQKGLTDPAWEIRAATVRSLDGQDDLETLALLQSALEDEHRLVRVAALRVLGHMTQSTALEYLLHALNDSEWEVREMAVLALGELNRKTPDLLNALLRLARHDPDGTVREAANYALNRQESEQALTPIPDPTPMIETVTRRRLAGHTALKEIRNTCAHYGVIFQKQSRLLHSSIWIGGLLIIILGTILSLKTLLFNHASIKDATLYLTLFTCISSGAGTAFLYGGENDPGLELTLSTATSIRSMMFFRFLWVVGYHLLLSFIASGIMAMLHGGGFWEIIHSWLGPVILFASIAFSISLLISSWISLLITLIVEALKMLVFHMDKGMPGIGLSLAINGPINPWLFVGALCLLIVAVMYAPRQPRLVSI